ncbi:MAG: 50S ribosomal protein L11 methyltransferase [Streptococcaceae bacterium]|jgi:ribosomal protein L11 methyltransferase|nr:50S ribosomal protein L11 methyltransferase [Streptococcaceae bacterium]
MEWFEVKVKIHREALDAVSDLLMRNGSVGVSILDSLDYLHYEEKFGEILPKIAFDEMVTVTAYYPVDMKITEKLPEIESAIANLATFGLKIGDFSLSFDALAEEDWANAWKKYFEPVRVTRHLTIVPSWTKYQAALDDELEIILDPGMAFGTGTHPTTRLCLQALEAKIRGGEHLIDVGTGSGVLSITASLLGVGKILATDIDEAAVRIAKENIELNLKPAQNIEVVANDLLSGLDFSADVIVANILADILVDLIEDANRLLKKEGILILSGIIEAKLPLIEAVYRKNGLVLEERLQIGEWVCLILRKTDADLAEIVGG